MWRFWPVGSFICRRTRQISRQPGKLAGRQAVGGGPHVQQGLAFVNQLQPDAGVQRVCGWPQHTPAHLQAVVSKSLALTTRSDRLQWTPSVNSIQGWPT